MAGIALTSLIASAAPPQLPGAEAQDPMSGAPVPLFSLLLPQQLMVLQQAVPQPALSQVGAGLAATETAGKVLPPGLPLLPLPGPSGPGTGGSLPGATGSPSTLPPDPGPVGGPAPQPARAGEQTLTVRPGGRGDSTDALQAVLQRVDADGQKVSPGAAETDFDSLPQPQLQAEPPRMVPDTAQTRAMSPARPEFHVPQPVTHPGWGDAMAARVSWQAAGGIQEARFHIHPPDLGPVDVRVNVSKEHASVQFLTHHVAVRDALEEALPRLREMLGANGLQLAEASISHQPPQQGHQGGGEGAGNTGGWRDGFTPGDDGGAVMEGEQPEWGVTHVSLPVGLVDAYA